MIKLIILILSLSQIFTHKINKENTRIDMVESGIYELLHIIKSSNQLNSIFNLIDK